MPYLQFKGKTFVQNHHIAVRYHQLVPRPDLSMTERHSLQIPFRKNTQYHMLELNSKDIVLNKLTNVNWDFPKSSTKSSIHSIHPYPAKFIPEIPLTLLDKLPLSKDTLVFDPFCGSGVTLHAAQSIGVESVGVDVNPIACLISFVKTNPIPPSFEATVNQILEEALDWKEIINPSDIPNLAHWFRPDAISALSKITTCISRHDEDSSLSKFLKFCLSSIIVKVSNQDSDTRYAAVEKNVDEIQVLKYFKEATEKIRRIKLSEIPGTKPASTIINKNILEVKPDDFEKKIGLIITSPPYPNAYEYWLYHKYRMWWLGFDPLKVKADEIGARSHYFKVNHQTAEDFITQMDKLMLLFSEVMEDGAFGAIVIGRSTIHGKTIDNEQIIMETAKRNGFSHVCTLPRQINSKRKSFNLSHARIKEEFIVIIQK